MKVYIVTNRGPAMQRTYDKINAKDHFDYQVELLVDEPELAARLHDAGYHARCHNRGPGVLESRLFALEHPGNKVLMLDDDLSNWAFRKDGKYIKGNDGDLIGAAFRVLDLQMNTHVHVGIGHRQFANAKGIWDQNGRILRALGYRTDVLRHERIVPTLPLMEDFELNLKLLTEGFGSMNYYGVVQDQPGSNNRGGCSDIRTLELQEHCARTLQSMFPDFVTLKKVDGWDIGPRWDVSVQWKKAYRSSL